MYLPRSQDHRKHKTATRMRKTYVLFRWSFVLCCAFLHMKPFLSTRRHPAHPMSVPTIFISRNDTCSTPPRYSPLDVVRLHRSHKSSQHLQHPRREVPRPDAADILHCDELRGRRERYNGTMRERGDYERGGRGGGWSRKTRRSEASQNHWKNATSTTVGAIQRFTEAQLEYCKGAWSPKPNLVCRHTGIYPLVLALQLYRRWQRRRQQQQQQQ